MTEAIGSISRETSAWKCDCGGYCEAVNSTEDECRANGCGRDSPGAECCAVAFECLICSRRYAGSREAPDVD